MSSYFWFDLLKIQDLSTEEKIKVEIKERKLEESHSVYIKDSIPHLMMASLLYDS